MKFLEYTCSKNAIIRNANTLMWSSGYYCDVVPCRIWRSQILASLIPTSPLCLCADTIRKWKNDTFSTIHCKSCISAKGTIIIFLNIFLLFFKQKNRITEISSNIRDPYKIEAWKQLLAQNGWWKNQRNRFSGWIN